MDKVFPGQKVRFLPEVKILRMQGRLSYRKFMEETIPKDRIVTVSYVSGSGNFTFHPDRYMYCPQWVTPLLEASLREIREELLK